MGGLINLVNKRNNHARPNNVMVIELLTGYISSFWLIIMWYCYSVYMQLSSPNANCRHFSAACERTHKAKSKNCHSNRKYWTAGSTV